nr:MAG TPA: hypothetical protein [Caudoviricetes sp.]
MGLFLCYKRRALLDLSKGKRLFLLPLHYNYV